MPVASFRHAEGTIQRLRAILVMLFPTGDAANPAVGGHGCRAEAGQ